MEVALKKSNKKKNRKRKK